MTLTPIQTVGDPSDAQYLNEAIADAKQVAHFAFQSASAEAVLLTAHENDVKGQQPVVGEVQKIQDSLSDFKRRRGVLVANYESLKAQIANASPEQKPALQKQLDQVADAIDLHAVIQDAIIKLSAMSASTSHAGLAGDIERMERTTPDLINAKAKPIAFPLDSLNGQRSAGLSTQASLLFDLLGTRDSIDLSLRWNNELDHQAAAIAAPIASVIQSMVLQSDLYFSAQQSRAGTVLATVTATPTIKGCIRG